MRTLPQELHPDLGLVDDDRTEDLRRIKNAPVRCSNTAGGEEPTTHQSHDEKGVPNLMVSHDSDNDQGWLPVNSDYHECCHAVGGHASSCPVSRLTSATTQIDRLREELNRELRALGDDAPLLACVDLVTALGHLKQASEWIGNAAQVIEAVQR